MSAVQPGSRTGSGRAMATALVVGLIVLLLAAPPAAGRQGPAAAPPSEHGAEATVTGAARVSTGGANGCVVLSDTRLRCWGWGREGELGNGTNPDYANRAKIVFNPTATGPLTGVRSVAIGYTHVCALLQNGQVRCWGQGGEGQLGNGRYEDSSLPVPVLNRSGTARLGNVTQISAGGSATCARLTSGEARCWGDNGYGQFGSGSLDSSALPVPVRTVTGPGALTRVAQLDLGYYSTCARLTTGEARCWGRNADGQVGDGTRYDRLRPVVVVNANGTGPLTAVRDISVGDFHACAVRSDATARCWGGNGDGQVGDGTTDPRLRPVVVAHPVGGPLRSVVSVDAGDNHSCARVGGGQVRCWGLNENGQVGTGGLNGPDVLLPSPVRNAAGTGTLVGVTHLDASAGHSCVRVQSGQARCWGQGGSGRLGNGADDDRALPSTVVT